MQVYYLPIQTFYNQVTLPTMLTSMPLIRDVIIREGITILHGHGVRSIENGAIRLHSTTTTARVFDPPPPPLP